MNTLEKQPRIRSFSRRQGRITPGQKVALESRWDKYCLDPEQAVNYSEVFERTAPLVMEIGFGNGDSLATMAEANPQLNYIGIEVHKPGVGHLLLQLEQRQLNNVRIYYHDAVEVLEQRINDKQLSAVHLFFPDPWPKRRHHKRRIIRPEFMALIAKKLKPKGYFHAATDWENYAKQMLRVLTHSDLLKNSSPTQDYCQRPSYRPLTKFEQRGLRLGHGVWDLVFERS